MGGEDGTLQYFEKDGDELYPRFEDSPFGLVAEEALGLGRRRTIGVQKAWWCISCVLQCLWYNLRLDVASVVSSMLCIILKSARCS